MLNIFMKYKQYYITNALPPNSEAGEESYALNSPKIRLPSSAPISVITPAYNAEQYVERAVLSALAQPEVAEVVLVEDGSTDGTLGKCRALAAVDTRVKLHCHPGGGNRGAAAARNIGLAKATQPLIAFLDADDYYLPGRFAVTLERLRDSSVDGVYEAIGVAYESEAAREKFLAARGDSLTADGLTTIRSGIAPEDLCCELLEGRAGFCSLDGLTLRREIIAKIGKFHEALNLHEDYHFLIRAVYAARLVAGTVDRPVTMRWVHGSNRITRATNDVSRPYMRALWRDLISWGLDKGMSRRVLRVLLQIAYRDSRRLASGSTARGVRGRIEWVVSELRDAPYLSLRWMLRLIRWDLDLKRT